MVDGATRSDLIFSDQNQEITFTLRTEHGEFTVIDFEAEEAVNTLFEIRLNLFSPDPKVDLHSLIDSQACLAIHTKYSEAKYLNGIVFEAIRGNQGIRRTQYTLVLRPALVRLANISDGKNLATQIRRRHRQGNLGAAQHPICRMAVRCGTQTARILHTNPKRENFGICRTYPE